MKVVDVGSKDQNKRLAQIYIYRDMRLARLQITIYL